MIDAGYRYKNIEKALGPGSILVLGKDIAETIWTKVLPKSGPKFSTAMNHMKSGALPALASIYKDLSTQIIEHELNLFTNCTTNMLVPGLGACDLMLDSGSSAFSDPTWAMDEVMNDMTSYLVSSNDELSEILGDYVNESELSRP